ncbi:hypothetical protein HUU59_08175 [bacterium]|nr:hypothetical protein [bacterium]
MENKLVIAVVIGIAFAAWALLELWWWFGRSWSPGEDLKDEMVRQYGAAKTWRYLFLFVMVLLVVWVLATSGWAPG